jgi:hypothetical protein
LRGRVGGKGDDNVILFSFIYLPFLLSFISSVFLVTFLFFFFWFYFVFLYMQYTALLSRCGSSRVFRALYLYELGMELQDDVLQPQHQLLFRERLSNWC